MAYSKLNINFNLTRRLPVILQTETSECGLACITMIANYWGCDYNLLDIRRRFLLSYRGTTLKDLVTIAEDLQFTSRPVRIELEQLHHLKCPCILHWNFNHFVVLKKANRRYLIIHDPGVGNCKISFGKCSHHFTGIALELMPKHSFKEEKSRIKVSFSSVMGKITGLKKGLLQLVLLGIMLQFCTLMGPLYLQWIVDEAIVTADRNLIMVLGIGFLLLVFLRTAIEAIRSWLTTILSTQLNFQWAGNVFSHVLKLPLAWFQRRHLGDITSRFNSIQEIQDGLTTKVVTGILDGLLVISTLLMMFLYSARLAIISFFAILLYAGLRWLAFKKQRYATSEFIINRANQESYFLESMRGIQSIRLYGNAEYRHIGWINLLAKEFNANLILERLSISFQAANTLLFNAERIIIIWLAALFILNNEFSVGMLLAFMSYKEQLSERIVSLIDNLCTIAMLKLHVERLADVVFSPPEKHPPYPETFHYDIHKLTTQIELRNVCFRYSTYEPFILENINLTIPANQSIAITGPSGCGKTTLLKLLLGLLTPTAGVILIGNVPLTRLNVTSLRTIIGSVMQDDHLFSGSIADNICFFAAEPDRERIESCAAMAVIHDEILAMSMGYNTLIGDIGSGLSGGQKQRILLARALYRQPKILALDEATSHLDTGNEQAVNRIISKFNLTKLIVAHRKETIMMANRVLTIEKANIISDYYNERAS